MAVDSLQSSLSENRLGMAPGVPGGSTFHQLYIVTWFISFELSVSKSEHNPQVLLKMGELSSVRTVTVEDVSQVTTVFNVGMRIVNKRLLGDTLIMLLFMSVKGSGGNGPPSYLC